MKESAVAPHLLKIWHGHACKQCAVHIMHTVLVRRACEHMYAAKINH